MSNRWTYTEDTDGHRWLCLDGTEIACLVDEVDPVRGIHLATVLSLAWERLERDRSAPNRYSRRIKR